MTRTEIVCIGDGDNIGEVVEFHLLSGELEEATKFSDSVKLAIESIAIFAEREIDACLIYAAGDDICFTVSEKSYISEALTAYSKYFLNKTGKTMSFGVGETPAEAVMHLRRAKVSGKGRIASFGEVLN